MDKLPTVPDACAVSLGDDDFESGRLNKKSNIRPNGSSQPMLKSSPIKSGTSKRKR